MNPKEMLYLLFLFVTEIEFFLSVQLRKPATLRT